MQKKVKCANLMKLFGMNSFMDNLRDIWISKRIIMIFMICLTLAGAYTGICPGDLKEKSTENHRFH